MERKSVAPERLLLDVQNPRLGQVQSQSEAIAEIIERQGDKLANLMRHIAQHGLSPTDSMLVLRRGRGFVVLEGNRRLAAIKLLANPDLAKGTLLEGAAKRVAKQATRIVNSVDCIVVASREEAHPWIVLRHRGQADGAGVVPWGSREGVRYEAKPGSQAAKAVAFLDAVEAGFPLDQELRELVEQVGTGRLTTLGRLIGDPEFRQAVGYEENSGVGMFRFDADALRPSLAQLLTDLATELTVSNIKSKTQRQRYVRELAKPDPEKARIKAKPLGDTPTKQPKKKSPRKPPRRPKPLLQGVELDNLGPRVDAVLRETQALSPENYPNATAIMLRVVLELTVDQLHESKGWGKDQKFKNRLRKALHALDATDRDPKLQSLRTGLQDASSLYAVDTLHAFLHNPHFHPTPAEARSIAANLSEFLRRADQFA
jgi:hypothetical protein